MRFGKMFLIGSLALLLVLATIVDGAEAPLPQTTTIKVEFAHYHLLLPYQKRTSKVELDRVGEQISGNVQLDKQGRVQLWLSGTLEGDIATLKVERTVEDATHGQESSVAVGTWQIDFADLTKPGTWTDATGAHPLPLRRDPDYPVMHDRLVFTAHMTTDRATLGLFPKDDCRSIYQGDAASADLISYDRVDVFSGTQHVQTLSGFHAESSCSIVVPDVEDADFDGYQDILVDRGGNFYGKHYLLWWRYDPISQRFVRDHALDAIQDDQGSVQELEFHPVDKTVRQYWESMGAPDVGEMAWRWQAGKLVEAWSQDCDDSEEFESGRCPRRMVPTGH